VLRIFVFYFSNVGIEFENKQLNKIHLKPKVLKDAGLVFKLKFDFFNNYAETRDFYSQRIQF
jgi:hypothetical protein